jgi:four helix bundle protein
MCQTLAQQSCSGKLKTENGKVKMESGNIIDLKTKAFAVRIIKFAQFLQEQKREFILSKQILRSGTSIGANTRERKNAASKADFINKFAIALKEADETQYWLELLYESNIIDKEVFDSLNNELKEIIAIITSSIKTAKK